MSTRYLRLGLALTLGFAAWIGCERTPMDVRIPNQLPRVALSAGPIRDSTNVYIATFNWNAADDDGQVVLFRYAIDDTSSTDAWFETTDFELTLFFTAPDSARADSIFIGQAQIPLERYIFNGAHTFFLKAVDDDGAESLPAALSFTAETLAPTTRIESPLPGGIVSLGPTFTVRWEGTDLDGTEEPVGFSWRLVRVVNVITMSDEEIEQALLHPNPETLPGVIGGEPWSPFEPRKTVRLNDLAVPGEYVFGVRALDQAGAIEPRMRTSRSLGDANALLIRAAETGGRPRLYVSSAVKTTEFPTGVVERKTFQIPANTDVLFSWEADASAYGGTIASFSWGVDLDDLAEDNPGWAPENATLTQVRINFAIPEGAPAEEHLLFVRARDDVGTTIIADVNLLVVPLKLERDVIYIDDFGRDNRGLAKTLVPRESDPYPEIDEPYCVQVSATTTDGRPGLVPDALSVTSGDYPQDLCHDEHLLALLERALDNIGLSDWVVDRYEALDPENGDALVGDVVVDSDPAGVRGYWVLTGPVTLEQLANYKIVVWNHRAFDTSMLKKMNREGEDNFLAVYLEAGGSAWITGNGTFSRTKFGNLGVGLAPFGYENEDFPFRFLKTQSIFEGVDCVNGCFRESGSNAIYQRTNGFEGAIASMMARTEGYPDLEVARLPFGSGSAANIKGVPSCEGMVLPTGLDINPRLQLFGGRLDTLYFYQSNGLLRLNLNSWMDNAATGLRYSGPDQGRLMMFGFPLFHLSNNQTIDVMTASLQWLAEPHR